MIEISSNDTLYMYNLYHIVKAFFPNEEIRQKVDDRQEPLVRLVLEGGSCFSITEGEIKGTADRQERKKIVTRHVYDWLSEESGRQLAWGDADGGKAD